jgi:antitoxin CptB
MAADSRLRWQCRRGMRELDLLLEAFLDDGCDRLDAEERAAFERLLSYPDALLLDYLMGRAAPAGALAARVVAKIRGADPA